MKINSQNSAPICLDGRLVVVHFAILSVVCLWGCSSEITSVSDISSHNDKMGPYEAFEQDILPPTFSSLSVSPSVIDVSAGPASITVSAWLSDNLSGVSNWQVYFDSPSGIHQAVVAGGPSSLVEGDLLHGLFESDAEVVQYSEPGIWTAGLFALSDAAGNREFFDLDGIGISLTFEVMSTPDVSAPTFSSLSVSPSVIDVSTGPASITVSAWLSDDLSGVSNWQVYFASPSGIHHAVVAGGTSSLVEGDLLHGLFEGDAEVDQYSEPGIWTAGLFALSDAAGNSDYLFLDEIGVSLTFEVISTPDVSAPTISSLSVSPSVIDVSNGPASITVSAWLSDDLSGVSNWQVYFDSPSGIHQAVVVGGISSLVEGDLLHGLFESDAEVDQYSEPGIWTAGLFALSDAAGNRELIDLGEIGISPTFEVVDGQEELVVTLIPHSLPIYIPSTGGGFFYDAQIENITNGDIVADVGLRALLPSGKLYNILIVPNMLFPANSAVTRNALSQLVPAPAPPGIYSFRISVGHVGVEMIDSDEFEFEKLSNKGELGFVVDWGTKGWVVHSED